MNQQTVSRDMKFLQNAAETISSFNSSSSANAPVQEGDVSSSNRPILTTESFGPELQNLQGFLFVVNCQGKIVSVTDNITQFLGYQPSEWPNASIYDFLHVTNHASFGQILSLLGDGRSVADSNKFVPPLPCRMRHGSSNAEGSDRRRDEETLVHFQISSLPYRINRLSSQTSPSSGSQMYLICVAQKVDDPLALYSRSQLRIGRRTMQQLVPSSHAVMSTKSLAKVDFTMHLTTDWTIHACDFSLLGQGVDFSNRFIGNKFAMFIHNNDLPYVQKYADTVSKGGPEEFSSNIYRFKLTDRRYVYIHSKSQLRPNSGADGTSLILSKHSIVRECHANELKGSASSSLMKAIIQSQPQTFSTIQDSLNIVTNSALGPEQTPNNFRHNGLHSAGNIGNSRPYQLTGTDQLPPGNMMSGLPQAPDLNFNDVYSSSRMSTGGIDFDLFETDWGSTASTQLTQTQGHTHSLGGQLPGQTLQSAVSLMQPNQAPLSDNKATLQELPPLYSNSYQLLPQSGNDGRLRDLLSTVTSPTDITTGEAITTSLGDQTAVSSDQVLRKLLQTEDDNAYLHLSALYTSTEHNGFGNSNSSIYSIAESHPVVPISTSGNAKGLEQHQLLKKLLTNDEAPTEDGEKTERNRILQKLLKDEDEEKQTCSGQKKSPPTPSPSESSSSSTRRHSSGGSNNESKARHREDSGRGTKRKISSASTVVTTTTTAIPEPDSTATTTNTSLLNQLLIKPLDTVNKVDPREVTATPVERIKAQRNTRHNSNVIDVVNDRIMIGAEQIDMKRLTSMVRTSEANSAALYGRQGSAGYPNGAVMVNQHRHAMDTGPPPPHPDMLMTPTYNSNGSKDFFAADGLISSPVFNQPTSRNNAPPSDFPQAVNSDGDSGSSMLHQLLNPDTDNLIIQELESLLGGNTSMQLTSPEDELAIKDIEKQLLYGTESLCPNKAFSGNTAEPHSPGFTMGLTDVPASASNPVHATAIYNIHHKPQISQNTPGYGAQAHNSPQLTQTLNDHLQQQGLSRGSSLAAIRANHRTMNRQGSGLVRSADGNMRRASGNSPSLSMSSFSPMGGPINQSSQANFVMPSNFGEMMKSTEPPPNVRLPQDMNSNSFPSRGSHMLRRELSSPHASRGSQNFAASPMDVTAPVSQHLHLGSEPYGSNIRSNMERQMMGGPFHGDQMGVSPNHPSINNNDIKSPQGVRSGQPSPAQSKHQYNHIDQWILSQRISSNAVSSSAFVKQEMKAKITARAQKQITSPQHQNFASPQHAMTSQQMSVMSPPTSHQTSMSTADPFATHMAATPMHSDLSSQDNYQDSVLPDDILNQITELTDTQNEIQQHQIGAIANPTHYPGENARKPTDHDLVLQKINQSKKDSSVVREQLRALAGGATSQSDGTLEKVFRTQLSKSQTSKTKTTAKTSSDPVEFEKLKQPAQNPVSIITVEPRPPVKDLQPTDQRNSLLQQLLTDSVSS